MHLVKYEGNGYNVKLEQYVTEEDGWTEELHFLSFVPALLAAMNKKALSLFVGFAGLYKLTGKGKKD